MGEPLELQLPTSVVVVPKTGAAYNRGESCQTYSTPADFMRAVVSRFGAMDFDLAADESNKKAPKFYSEADNAFSHDWRDLKGNLWLNPPFGDIEPWARKCSESRAPRWERRIYLLTPASVGANWFARHVHNEALVLALNGRMSFDGVDQYPGDLILSIYGEPPGFDCWRWTDELQTNLFEAKR